MALKNKNKSVYWVSTNIMNNCTSKQFYEYNKQFYLKKKTELNFLEHSA